MREYRIWIQLNLFLSIDKMDLGLLNWGFIYLILWLSFDGFYFCAKNNLYLNWKFKLEKKFFKRFWRADHSPHQISNPFWNSGKFPREVHIPMKDSSASPNEQFNFWGNIAMIFNDFIFSTRRTHKILLKSTNEHKFSRLSFMLSFTLTLPTLVNILKNTVYGW